jgi:ferrous iron transport protein B
LSRHPASASKNKGLEHFEETIRQTLSSGKLPACPLFSNTVERYITPIIADDYLHNLPQGRPMRWAAIKLIEQDELFLSSMPPVPTTTQKLIDQARAALTVTYDDDPEAVIIDQRYKVAEKICAACQTTGKKEQTILTGPHSPQQVRRHPAVRLGDGRGVLLFPSSWSAASPLPDRTVL